MYSTDNPDFTSTQTLAIINSTQEIEVGVGYNWKPVVIGNGQIQIPEQLAIYLNVTKGSDVRLSAAELFGGQLAEALQHPMI